MICFQPREPAFGRLSVLIAFAFPRDGSGLRRLPEKQSQAHSGFDGGTGQKRFFLGLRRTPCESIVLPLGCIVVDIAGSAREGVEDRLCVFSHN